jgi:hypothetical protein
MVQDLLKQWRQGGHGYVPDVKGNDTIRVGCENANSLSLFDQRSRKLCKLINLHNKYQTDGACIVELGTNFLMAADGQRPEDIFAAFLGFTSVRGAQCAQATQSIPTRRDLDSGVYLSVRLCDSHRH